MRDEQVRPKYTLPKFFWLDELHRFDVPGLLRCVSDLSENVHAGTRYCPIVDSLYEPIERHLRADRNKDPPSAILDSIHSTAPLNCGPSGLARCAHWVSHRSAYLPIFLPDKDIMSTLAMLSIQIVLAPRALPTRIAT